uniref:Uncharacterized protein n=1 Tax=Picea sitchensis TaxID=3332 RepID=D5AAS8_PICSI|nr:unknown [Picea sitchensis]
MLVQRWSFPLGWPRICALETLSQSITQLSITIVSASVGFSAVFTKASIASRCSPPLSCFCVLISFIRASIAFVSLTAIIIVSASSALFIKASSIFR